MKIMLLAGLYLFFVRVLWSVYNELRDPRTRVQRRADGATPDAAAMANAGVTTRRPGQVVASPSPAPTPPMAPPPDRAPVPASAGAVATATPIQVGQLTILEPPPLAGLTWALGNEITLGRASSCGVHLDDTYVSSVHARIFNRNGTFMVEDLDSRNGSVLNGAPLTVTTALQPGDRVQLGATILEFS